MTVPAMARRWDEPAPGGARQATPGQPGRAGGAPAAAGRPGRAGGPPAAAGRPGGRGGAASPAAGWIGGAVVPDRVGTVVRDRAEAARRAAPLGAVLLTALVAQVSVLSHLGVRGMAPDGVLVAVAAVAVVRGPRVGAGFGFAAGLGADLFLATPLGTAALAYTVVGHVLGGWRRSPASGTAAALCRPDRPCYACRAGRRHRSGLAPAAAEAGAPGVVGGGVPGVVGAGAAKAVGVEARISVGGAAPATRRKRGAANRRAGLQRAAALTFAGVAAGRIGVAGAGTALAGAPFPSLAAVVRIVAAAAVSAPLGPAVFAAVGRVPVGGRGGGRRWG